MGLTVSRFFASHPFPLAKVSTCKTLVPLVCHEPQPLARKCLSILPRVPSRHRAASARRCFRGTTGCGPQGTGHPACQHDRFSRRVTSWVSLRPSHCAFPSGKHCLTIPLPVCLLRTRRLSSFDLTEGPAPALPAASDSSCADHSFLPRSIPFLIENRFWVVLFAPIRNIGSIADIILTYRPCRISTLCAVCRVSRRCP